MKAEWSFSNPNLEKAQYLSDSLGISIYTSKILINRGIESLEDAKKFLSFPKSLNMVSWNIELSKKIGLFLKDAIEKQTLITVHGDYDVDGVTGAGVLAQFLSNKGANFNYFLPDRFGSGYGLNKDSLQNMAENGTKILITADCGISNNEEIDFANSLGMEVIVTDHHTLPEVLPNAKFIFHPALSENKNFHILSGVGTAFQLIYDIDELIPSIKECSIDDYIDLVTIGTIADISPLRGINRDLVKYGLIKISNTKRVGLLKLMNASNLNTYELAASDISYKIVPKLNAAGRMDKAILALDLLLTDDEERANTLFDTIERLNKERQELCEKTFFEAEEIIAKEVNLEKDKAIIIAKEGFHHGVIGIICSRLVEKYNRPTFVMAKEGEFTRGSARSTNLDLVEALSYADSLLLKYGGHKGAAGWKLKTENFEGFRQEILKFAETKLSSADLIPKLNIDIELPIEEINYQIFRELQELEPFGLQNPQPVIAVKNCTVEQYSQHITKNNSHLFFYVIGKNNKKFKTVYWYGGDNHPLEPNIDMVYSIYENKKGKIGLELKVNALKSEKKNDSPKLIEDTEVKAEPKKEDLKIIKKVPTNDLLEISFPLKQMISSNIFLGYLCNTFGIQQINFPANYEVKKQTTFEIIDCRLEEDVLAFIRSNELKNKRISIFSKNNAFSEELLNELKNSAGEVNQLILLDIPYKKVYLNYLLNIIKPEVIYLFSPANDFFVIDSKVVKNFLKILYMNSGSAKVFLENYKKEFPISLLQHLLNILLEAEYIVFDNSTNFIKISEKNININELEAYKKYCQEKEAFDLNFNLITKASINKIKRYLDKE